MTIRRLPILLTALALLVLSAPAGFAQQPDSSEVKKRVIDTTELALPPLHTDSTLVAPREATPAPQGNLERPAFTTARDSVIEDLEKNILYYFGNVTANYGDISITPDSVFIYGDEAVTRSIKEVNISPVNVTGLAEPLERNIMLRPIKDVRIEPRRVKLSVPVEPLIRKELSVPVVVRNAPTSLSVIVFPSSLKVSFLLPQSLYKKTHNDIVAIVDYNDIEQNPQAHKVHIATVEAPVIYSNIKLSSDSVEFIIDY